MLCVLLFSYFGGPAEGVGQQGVGYVSFKSDQVRRPGGGDEGKEMEETNSDDRRDAETPLSPSDP
jgi:hypothetical protein